MKGFLQEYGIIMVVVAVVLGMLAFGKTGYAKSIQDAILGSADHIVETGENITKSDKKEVNVKTGDLITIEGQKYIVLESNGNNALVMTTSSIGYKSFQWDYDSDTYLRPDGQHTNTYEGSTVDNYLENDWYNSLTSTMKTAIQTANIKQASYATDYDSDSKQETGYNGQVYNTISRHVFLPSVNEIGNAINLKNKDKVKTFINNTKIDMWTRDSNQSRAYAAEYLSGHNSSLGGRDASSAYCVYPALVIDLSQIDYAEAGHVDYK